MENLSLMLRVDQRIDELAGLTFLHYGIEIKRPQVCWDERGLSAGTVFLTQQIMSLNPVLAVENPDEFIEDTIGHEWGHLAQARIYPRSNKFRHGKQWQSILKTLKVPINIDHRYSVRTIVDHMPLTLDEIRGFQVCPTGLGKEEQFYQNYVERIKVA